MDGNPAFATLTLAPAIDSTIELDRPLTPGKIHHVTDELRRAGGKGINVALMLASRGKNVVAGGILGEDNYTEFKRLLADVGVEDRFMRVPGATRQNTMLLQGGQEFKINRPAFPDLDYADLNVRSLIAMLVDGVDVVIVSGSIPQRFPQDVYGKVVRVLRAMGKMVVFDASGEALKEGLSAKPLVCKPNRSECEQFLGREICDENDFIDACRKMNEYCDTAIITDGGNGSWFSQGDAVLHASTPDVAVFDTTAAGDMFLGEFCARFFPSMRLSEDTIGHASAAGAATVSIAAGMRRCPSVEAVRKLAERVVITRY